MFLRWEISDDNGGFWYVNVVGVCYICYLPPYAYIVRLLWAGCVAFLGQAGALITKKIRLIFLSLYPELLGVSVLTFLDRVTDGLDRGESVDVIFLDFAKAFDKVPHERQLRKMEAYGIGGEVLAWVREWLRDRKQRVRSGSCWSEWCRVLIGVPQGSVLGLILLIWSI